MAALHVGPMLHGKVAVSGGTSVATAYAAGQISLGDIGGMVCAVVAVLTLALGILASNAKKMRDSFDAGKESRDDEVRQLQQWAAYYRDQAQEARQQAGLAPHVPLPPPMFPTTRGRGQ